MFFNIREMLPEEKIGKFKTCKLFKKFFILPPPTPYFNVEAIKYLTYNLNLPFAHCDSLFKI